MSGTLADIIGLAGSVLFIAAYLYSNLAKTIDFLKSAPAGAINDKEGVEVVLKFPNGEFKFDGISYVLGFATPNFYFHITTAYDILRMKGVPIGKINFLGGI